MTILHPKTSLVTQTFLSSNGNPVDVGNWYTENLITNTSASFNFATPDRLHKIKSAKIIIIPDATETIQFDLSMNHVKAGQLYDANPVVELNRQQAVTLNQITEIDVTNLFVDVEAGEYVGFRITSDLVAIRVVMLKFNFLIKLPQ